MSDISHRRSGGSRPVTNLSFFFIEQFAVPAPDTLLSSDIAFVVQRVLELTYASHAIKPFAEDLGYMGAPFAWNADRRALLRAELDAKIASLYGLTRDQLRYILDPADVYGPDYPSETFRVLKNNDIAKYGEYRTAKLVLQAFDQLTLGKLTTEVVRLDKDKLEIRTSECKADRPTDGAWARPRTDQRGETGAMLVALLKALSGPLPSRQVRLAAIVALEPRLLHAHLDQAQSTEWKRLIGNEAEPLSKGAVQFVPPQDQHWGAAVRGLRTSGALVENLKAATWATGQGLDGIEIGRHAYVLLTQSGARVGPGLRFLSGARSHDARISVSATRAPQAIARLGATLEDSRRYLSLVQLGPEL